MVIKENTNMLLFRFRDFGKYDFIDTHREFIEKNGYVWLLKIGKKTSSERLSEIQREGGWMILRSPKADGGKSYVVKFVSFTEETPNDGMFPEYYEEVINSEDFWEATCQWFKIDRIISLSDEFSKTLVMAKTQKPIDEVIGATRTAVMFVKNVSPITID